MPATKVQPYGPACGQHGIYSFYKSFKYLRGTKQRIISTGDFFFMEIDNDLPAIGEIQLVWTDKNSTEAFVSLKIYYLPAYVSDSKQEHHGQDEVIAEADKVVVSVDNLAKWLTDDAFRHWMTVGHRGPAKGECQQMDDINTSSFLPPAVSVQRKRSRKADGGDDLVIVTYAQYCRYRAALKRLEGVTNQWLRHTIISALGGFSLPTGIKRVLFVREVTSHTILDQHPFRLYGVTPTLKGRPRKRKLNYDGDSDSDFVPTKAIRTSVDSKQDDSSNDSIPSTNEDSDRKWSDDERAVVRVKLGPRGEPPNQEREDFLLDLKEFMRRNNTPVERAPFLGFKQLDLFRIYKLVKDYGGYEAVCSRRLWKNIYDTLGGNPTNTSAATCTRRHYERLILPFERYLTRKNSYKTKETTNGFSILENQWSEIKAKHQSSEASNQLAKRQVARRTVKDELEARQIEIQTSSSNKLSTGRRTIKDELEARKIASLNNGLSLPQSLPQTVPQSITQSFSQSSNPTNGFVELAVPTVENPTSNKPEQAADVANNNCSMNGITALTLPFNVPMLNGKFNLDLLPAAIPALNLPNLNGVSTLPSFPKPSFYVPTALNGLNGIPFPPLANVVGTLTPPEIFRK